MSSADHADRGAPRTTRPVGTWALMLVAVVVVLLLPDWFGVGIRWPLWVIASPVALGLAGAVLALRRGHPWWAAVSAVWGFALIQGSIVAVTWMSGP